MPLKPERFRELALELPHAEEGAHHGHADFRVGGKIFATLRPDEDRAMVRLPPAEQTLVVTAEPEAFQPVPGAWGRQGCTHVTLSAVRVSAVREALHVAWRHRAPKRLIEP